MATTVYTQNGKPMRLTTPLPADTLLIERLAGEEGVSQPFELTLDLLSADAAIDPKKLLRQPVSLAVDLLGGGQRHFHGLVRRFVQLGRDDVFVSYRAEVVPAMWFLSLSSDCRVFQRKSVPDIVKQVLSESGVTDVKVNLTAAYAEREYCVQYRESDLAFVSRLMEEEGIFYFFEHSKDKHTLILADAPSAVKPGPSPKLRMSLTQGGKLPEDVITELELDSEVVSGKVMLADYNFETPAVALSSTVAGGNRGTSVEQLATFDYPGKFLVRADGDRLARLRLEESESLGVVVNGVTNYRGLASGQKLEVTDHYRRDVNQAYQVISATHAASEAAYRTAGAEQATFEFQSTFEAIPSNVPYRPERVTPRSAIAGSQTAVVVGPAGEEIYVDKYGRVKVQFFWDRQGKKDADSSCWVRVSSGWAGKQWGFIQLPRIGQEVIVDFLEGDPDRPLITGRVYNAEQMPPYALPANQTQSGIKTRSSAAGGADNFNELRFEDKKGEEQVFLHAERNFDLDVEADETHTVGHDQTVHIKNNRTESVDKDETITIHGARTEAVDGDETITVKGNRAVTIKQGNESLTVSAGNRSIDVSKGNHETKVSLGNVTLKAAAGSISYDALQGLELKVGQNSIKIDQAGITIKGMVVKIEGQISTEMKGLMTTVKGDAMLTVKGGITMIN